MNRVEELVQYFNNTYGLEKEWPKQFEVSAELYGKVCQAVLNKAKEDIQLFFQWEDLDSMICVQIGPNNGIMFKNVELRIKE